MSTSSNKGKVAIVGRGENLDWFDTMAGEQMAVRLHGWTDLGRQYDIWIVEAPLVVQVRS